MKNSRRKFLTSVSMLAASTVMPISQFDFGSMAKLKIALVGTGIRGTTFWGKRLVDQYSDILEFVGLCDINPGRLEFSKKYIGVSCPVYSNFEEMIRNGKPDLVIVTTKDSTHHEFIIKGMQMGCDVLTEKPLTTDETKCQAILDTERKTQKNLIVGFNYRWSPYATKVKELLMKNTIGKITSVDFHWYLNTYHGASYFRRWHGQMESGGSLWVHKSTHHFDLLNWWINSEPAEVFAYGDLEFYGKNGVFRGDNCRDCEHKTSCEFHWDITKNKFLKELYTDHEQHDGYIRDNCLFRNEIDIYDKMSAQVRYQNNVQLNYSLTTYSPLEGWRAAFNGTEGRIEAWADIPYYNNIGVDQAEMHAREMDQTNKEDLAREPLIIHNLWKKHQTVHVEMDKKGHGGGDQKLQDNLFRNERTVDPYDRVAGSRDGAMSILVGIAARKSIEQGTAVKISELTDLVPKAKRT
ncbi:MAG: Gfo/Idh/MocA family oxidoreductase [Eudoraea sp.]|nr:Gfo/Idh/MocA family oxidoreductase [Eudoraea sp.]